MGLALALATKSLIQRPGRTLFSVLGIGVGIATVAGIFTLDHNTLLDRARSDDPDWRAEIEVSPSAVVRSPREELRRVPGVTHVAAAFQADAVLAWSDGEKEVSERVHLVAMDAEGARRLGAVQLLEGALLDSPTSSGLPAALLGESLARRLAIARGARIRLARPARAPASECIEGEWRIVEQGRERAPQVQELEVAGILAREGVGRRAGGEVCLIDYEVGRRLFEGAHVDTRYWLKHDPGINLERIQSSLGQAWSYDLKKSVIIGQAADERAFRNGVRFAGLLALVLGLYVIFHTLSMSLIERVREIGVLHALGTTRVQIGRVFFAEALLIAGLGGLVGLGGGLALARFLLTSGVTTMGVGRPIRLFEVPWPVVAPLVAAGVIIALIGSIYPLSRARHTDAVSALRGEEAGAAHGVRRSFQLVAAALLALVLPAIYFGVVPVIGEAQRELVGVLMLGTAVLALFVALPLIVPALLAWVCVRLAAPFERAWPLSGRLAARAMQRGPARVAGAVAGIALVTAGYVGLRGMTRSLEGEIASWGREAYLDKLYVRNAPRRPFEEVARAMRAIPGVLAVEPNEARTYVPFLVVGLKERELASFGPCRDQPELVAALAEERGMILSRRLARHRGYEVGEEVHVSTPRGAVESFRVIAVSDAYGYFPHPDERLYGVVSDRWMKELFCVETDTVSTFSLRLDEGADLAQVRALVQQHFPEKPLDLRDDGPYLYAWHTSDIARDFVLFDILIALTASLAALGVLNGQLLAALERAKELGVLKALGMTRAQVAGMVMLEEAAVGAIAGLLGAALGSVLAPAIVSALQVISGLPLPHAGAGAHLALGWAGAVALALLAGLYPVWRMTRSDALAAIRTGA